MHCHTYPANRSFFYTLHVTPSRSFAVAAGARAAGPPHRASLLHHHQVLPRRPCGLVAIRAALLIAHGHSSALARPVAMISSPPPSPRPLPPLHSPPILPSASPLCSLKTFSSTCWWIDHDALRARGEVCEDYKMPVAYWERSVPTAWCGTPLTTIRITHRRFLFVLAHLYSKRQDTVCTSVRKRL